MSARRYTGRLLALALAALATMGAVVAPPTSSRLHDDARRPAAEQAEPEDPALADLGACVAERNRLSVLFLIDESGSLRDTDPGAARVTAVKTALLALGSLASTEVDGTKPQVDVRFAGFAENYTPYGDWTRIEGDDSVAFLGAASEQFAERNRGFDTDYVSALDGARQDLATQAAEQTEDGGQAPCQALVWFTDGKFDIENRDTSAERDAHGTSKYWASGIDLGAAGGSDAAEARGRELLCSGRDGQQSLADQLRSDDVTSIGIALTNAIAPEDEQFLEGLVTGSSPVGRCGNPGTTPQGTFLPAADLTQLILAFNRAFNQGATSPDGPQQTPICEATADARCTLTFDVDAGLRRFNLLVVNEAEGVTVVLTGPGGETISLSPGEDGRDSIGTARLRWHWTSPEVVAVDTKLDPDHDDWVGTWSASFVSDSGQGVTTSEVFLYGNLQPSVPDDLEFTLAQPTDIPVTVIPQEGTPETLDDLIRDSTVVASVRQGRGDRRPLEVQKADNFHFSARYEPSPDLAARTVRLRLELAVTTSSGIELRPVIRDVDVPVSVPPVYPTIVDTEVHPPSISGDGSTEAVLHVEGSTIADGCVWVEGFALDDGPGSVEAVGVSTDPSSAGPDDCVRVEANQSREIRVAFEPDGSGQGAVSGTLRAGVSSERADDPIRVEIPTEFRMSVPAGQERWLYFFLLMALGVAIPLLLLWLVKWWSARFEPPARMSGMAVPVVVTAAQTVTRDSGEPLTLTGADFNEMLEGSTQDRVRSFLWHGYRFHVSARGNPFEAPKGWISLPEGDEVHRLVSGWTGSTGGKLRRGGSRAEVPLHLRGAWFFVARVDDLRAARSGASSDAPPPGGDERAAAGVIPGTLYAFIEDGIDRGREAATVSEAVVADLGGVVQDLVAAVPEPAVEPPPSGASSGGDGPRPGDDPWKSGPTGRPSMDEEPWTPPNLDGGPSAQPPLPGSSAPFAGGPGGPAADPGPSPAPGDPRPPDRPTF